MTVLVNSQMPASNVLIIRELFTKPIRNKKSNIYPLGCASPVWSATCRWLKLVHAEVGPV